MQTWRLPLLLCTMCLVVLGYIVVFEQHLAGTAEKLYSEKRLFPRFNPNAAHRVTLRVKKSADLRLVLKDGQWQIEQPFSFTADNFAVDDLLWTLADIEYLQKISVKKDSPRFEDYGLAEPRVVLRANWGKKDEIELRIGSESARPGAVYAQIRKNDIHVFAIPSDILSQVLRPLDDWRNKTLIRLADEEPHAIVVENNNIRHELRRIANTWRLISPDQADLDSAKVNSWLAALLSARAASYGDDALQDAARRIQPESLISLEIYNENNEIIAGLRFAELASAGSKAQTLARRIGQSIWMCLEENQKSSLLPDPDSLRDRRLLTIPTSSISKMNLTGNNTSLTILRSAERWIIPGYPHALDNFAVEDYIERLASIRPDDAIAPENNKSEERFLSLQFWQKLDSGEEILSREISILRSGQDSFFALTPAISRAYRLDVAELEKILAAPNDFREKKFSWKNLSDAEFLTLEDEQFQTKVTIPRGADLLEISQLLQSAEVAKWLTIENCPDVSDSLLTISATDSMQQQSQLRVCICDGAPCGMIFQNDNITEAFQPASGWFSVFKKKTHKYLQETKTATNDLPIMPTRQPQ